MYSHWSPEVFPGTSSSVQNGYLVTPFWDDVDISGIDGGSIYYQVHTATGGNAPSLQLLDQVNSFINTVEGDNFTGVWMLVAMWDQVHPYPHGILPDPSISPDVNEVCSIHSTAKCYACMSFECEHTKVETMSLIWLSYLSQCIYYALIIGFFSKLRVATMISLSIFPQVNSYQAIIITDHTSQAYAVFTYKCGDLNWARGPTIGFNAASQFYDNYDLSGSTNADIMDCFNSPINSYFNLVYNISAEGFVPPPPLPTSEPRKCRGTRGMCSAMPQKNSLTNRLTTF